MMPGTKHIRIGRVIRMYEDIQKVIFYRKMYDKNPDIKSLIDTKRIIEMHFPEVIKKTIVDN